MVAAVDAEDAVHLHRRVTVARHLSVDPVRTKNDFGISGAFEDFLVHLLVAHADAAVTAGRVHD